VPIELLQHRHSRPHDPRHGILVDAFVESERRVDVWVALGASVSRGGVSRVQKTTNPFTCFLEVPAKRLSCKPLFSSRKTGAGEGIRTLDPNLGKIQVDELVI
jgi:hypothetical protein